MTYLPRYFQVFCLKWKVFHQHNEIPYYASLFQYSCIKPFYISEELIENVPFGLFHMKIESVNCHKTFHKTSFCIFAPPYCSTGASRFPGSCFTSLFHAPAASPVKVFAHAQPMTVSLFAWGRWRV